MLLRRLQRGERTHCTLEKATTHLDIFTLRVLRSSAL
jgi:hypothetical protein